MNIRLQQGDITTVQVDAIVNAANERMLGGGGVDGAIHRAAGPELLTACREIEEVRHGVRCPTGKARLTAGFRLQARHVIHTVGPVYRSAEASSPLLAAAYRSCLELARTNGLQTIAFPAISCGVYRYPLDEAAAIAIGECLAHGSELREIIFMLFGTETFSAWERALFAAH